MIGAGHGSLGEEEEEQTPPRASHLSGVVELTPFPLWDENPARETEQGLPLLTAGTRAVRRAPQVPWLSWGCTWCSATAPPCSATSSASSTPPTPRKYPSHTWGTFPALR